MKEYSGLEIAIIGMAGKFPGAADLRAFWDNLTNGVESISFFTDEELIREGVDKSLLDNPRYVKAHGLLEDKDCFDSLFFNYRPDEAKLMEPQMRIFHECVWAALEDAGCNPDNEKNKIGLFTGSASNINWEIYAQLMNRNGDVDRFSVSLLANPRFIATKTSYDLNLKGPSVYLDTACSTSLVAVHEACKSLLLGECNIAIAGGIHVTGKSRTGYMYEEGMIHSKDGHNRTFDNAASGTVGGEGVGVVVLKSLKNALKDGDHIWAIVKGSGINNDGNNKVGYTAPSIHGQVEAILMAQKWARIRPESISYIEAHGTATKLGDPIEVEALSHVFGSSTEKYCALGSVKSNIGHLDAAAGIAGLIKTVLALKYRQIPPSLHFQTLNEEITLDNTPFYVNTILRDWQSDKGPLRAGVSSFGIGGTNAHVILEEAPEPTAAESRNCQLLMLSAKTPAALERATNNFYNYLNNSKQVNLADVAYTLQAGRKHFPYRKYIVCSNRSQAISLPGSGSEIKNEEPVIEKADNRIVFMFSGQGAQYVNMCYDLYTNEPDFKEDIDKCFTIIKQRCGKDLLPVLFENGADQAASINNTEYAQPLLFVVEYAMARLLMKWGVSPHMMIGHSIGEYVAACISGVFSLEDALWLVVKRGELMQGAPRGLMLSISASQDTVRTLLANNPDISLAAVNSSSLCVVSGTEEAVHVFKRMLEKEGYENKVLRTSHAFHSYMMNGILDQFGEAVKQVTIHPLKVPFISNVTGDWATDAEISRADYWVHHLRQTVLFSTGIEKMLENKHLVFVEVGPGRALGSMVRSNQKRTKKHKVCQMVRNADDDMEDQQYLFTSIGQLWLYGVEPNWNAMYKRETRRKISLPSYPFEKTRYPVCVNAFKMLTDLTVEDHQKKSADEGQRANHFFTSALQTESTVSDYSSDTVATTLLTLWQNFFGRPDITAEDDFFDIGGDSLKALTMIGRIHKNLNIEIPVKEFFSNSSVNRLAVFINNLNAQLAERQKHGQYQSIQRSIVQDWYPLSSTQKRLYFLYEFDRSSLAYNMPQVVNIKGPVNKEKFRQIVNRIVNRHEILRTYVDIVGEEPVQRIADGVDIPLEYFQAGIEKVPAFVEDFIRPFDLNKGPLVRTGLIEVDKDEHVFMIDMHHFVSDGVSFRIFLNEFMTLYKGGELEELTLQFRDYAMWQASETYQQAVARERNWWLQEFSEEVTMLDLPLDYHRPLVRSYKGATIHFLLSDVEMECLRKIADTEGVTLFMAILSVYSILLGKLAAQNDVVIGTPTAGRIHADLENIMGMFVNTVAIRTNPGGELSYRNFLRQLKSKTLTVFDQQAYPYELLIEEINVTRDTSRNPLFDVWFVYQNWNDITFELPELDITPFKTEAEIAQFDLALTAGELNGVMHLNFEYSTELFKPDTIERLIAYFHIIIGAIASDADRTIASIDLVQGKEKELLLHTFNNTNKPIERVKTFFELFAEQAARTPQHIAVEHNSMALSYDALYERAVKLSHYLIKQNIGAGSRVALYMPRGVDMLTAILGIFAAGAAYVPIETDYPLPRVYEILEDCEASILLVNDSTKTKAEEIKKNVASLNDVCCIGDISTWNYPAADWRNRAAAQDIAYIIYTSGTTGKPKGAMVHQLGMLNHMYGMIEAMTINENDVLAQTASCSFDISVWQLLCALITGGRTCIVDKEKMLDAGLLLKEMHEKQVTIAEMVPSVLRPLLDEAISSGPAFLHSLRWMIPTAEQISLSLAKRWYDAYPHIPLINAYGPAEASDDVTLYVIEKNIESPIIPVGKPIGNIRIYILDKYQNLCPVGVCGEICIAGVGVGKGYWKDPLKTARAFVPNPFVLQDGDEAADYGTLYLTGDTGYYQWDGNLVFTGRRDHQVKIRGHRIELGEIESHLLQHELVKETTVLAREKDNSKYLVAYYISDESLQQESLRSYLLGKLPDYMVPAFYVWLPKMPLTVNGKLDRKALPEPKRNDKEGSFVTPNTPEEQLLVDIWNRVLETERISTTDNFFSVGGDSIKSTQIISRLRSAGYQVSVKDIFMHQTIRELAGRLRRTDSIKDQSAVTGTASLTPVQQLFFQGPIQRKHHYNQSVMLNFPAGIQLGVVKKIFTKIQEHHDALRMIFVKQHDGEILVQNQPLGMDVWLKEYDLRADPDAATMLTSYCNEIQAAISLESGPLMRVALFHMENGSRLLIAIHHLVVDGISWRIMFEDIETLYTQINNNEALVLPLKTDSFITWPVHIAAYIKSDVYKNAIQYWLKSSAKRVNPIPRDYEDGASVLKYNITETIRLNTATTSQLLTRSHQRFGTRINDLLLSALLMAVHEQYGVAALQIDLEGHGREDIGNGIDISRTIGWFTSIYPVVLQSNENSLTATIKNVKEILRQIPNNGIDYGIWKYADRSGWQNDQYPSRIIFNYLGQFDADIKKQVYTMATEPSGNDVDPDEINEYDWEILGLVTNGQLELKLHYSPHQYNSETISSLMKAYKESLEAVIACCCAGGKKEYTPSDCTYKELPVEKLDELQAQYELEDVCLLSPMQEGMLFHSLYDEQGTQYFEQLVCRISGVLHIDAVEQTMNDIIVRYPVLRTAFVHDGYKYPLQVVVKERKIEFLYKDVRSECETQEIETVINHSRKQDGARPFNLRKDVLMRLTVLQVGNNEYAFLWSYHHVLMDGWCMGIIFNDFMELYQAHCSGKSVTLPAVQPYARYLEWLQKRDREEAARYWQQYLLGYEQPATMAYSNGNPQMGSELAIEQLVIDRSQTEMLRRLSVQYGVTINIILQAAWGILLSKYNNTCDVVFGSVVSGRPTEIEGIEDMVGLFINTVPVRVTWNEKNKVADLLRRMQETALNAEPHHYHPLSEIQALSALGRQLLDHILVFENYPLTSSIKKSVNSHEVFSVTDVEATVQTNYDLAIVIVPGDEICINFKYTPRSYDLSYIQRITAHFENILHQIGDGSNMAISDIEIVTEQEKQQLLQLHGPISSVPQRSFVQLFDEQAVLTPNYDAIIAGNEKITYAELQKKSETLAASLSNMPGLGEIVAIYAEPSIQMFVGILAILRSGRAFLPLDPAMHKERQEKCLQESKVKLLLTQQLLKKDLRFSGSVLLINVQHELKNVKYTGTPSTPESLAYVIYTSGSTGQPKGVKIKNSNLINYVQWFKQKLSLAPGNQSILTSSYAYDLGYSSVFPILASGGALHVVPSSMYHAPEDLLRYISGYPVTYLKLTPSLFKTIVGAPSFGKYPLPGLKYILLGGEPLVPGDIDMAMNAYPHWQFINHYGPTETTIGVIAQQIDDWENYKQQTAIGKPINNVQAFILNKNQQLMPVGLPGELCIGGDSVGAGYLNRDEITAEKFVAFSLAKDNRIYRTGDLARWLPNGTIEFLGRIDHQIKIRGYRVELGEIEYHLSAHSLIKDAVIVCSETDGNKYLIAYYVSQNEINAFQLREFLLMRLPDFMVPAYYVHVNQLPLTPNGKLNTKALPAPDLVLQNRYVAAQSKTELLLVEMWSELLRIRKERIGINDDFFALGAHSIIAIRLSYSIQQQFQVTLSMRQIFENPTIEQLARLILVGSAYQTGRIQKIEQREYYPVSSAQERLFYEHSLHKDIPVYNNCTVYKIVGDLDQEKLINSFQVLIARHESLRTGFLMTDEGIVQVIHSSPDFNLVVLNENSFNTVHEAFYSFVKPFDLSKGPLIRVGLLQHEKEENLLFVDIHHIICDGISKNILMNDFKNIYQGNNIGAPPAITYVDYSCWQRNLNGALHEQENYWLNKLTGRLVRPDLPLVSSDEGDEVHYAAYDLVTIEGNSFALIKELAKNEEVSIFMFFLSVYYLLLSKVTGSMDIIIGTESTGRTQDDLHNVVGTFVNILPLRMQLKSHMSFRQLLQEVKINVLEAYENQDFQYDQIIAALQKQENIEGELIDAHFSLVNTRHSTIELNEVQFIPYEGLWSPTTDQKLSVQVSEENERFNVYFIYSKALFDRKTIELLMNYYHGIVSAVLKNVETTIDSIEVKSDADLVA